MNATDAASRDGESACLESPRANDTLYWQLLTVSLLGLNTASQRMTSVFRHRHQPHVGHVYPLSRRMVVKTGSDVRLTEAATMKFIAEKTNIPVPRVLSAFLRNGAAYIVMEKIEGQELAKLWHHISDETRANLLGQLRQIVDELRALEPPSEFCVGSCTGGSLQDFRQSRAPPPVRFGPFRTMQDFHSWLRDGLKQGEAENMEQAELDSVNEMIARQDGPWPPPVFTHGDLNPSNILVRDDKIVGIIDWEMSGWYPHYWEYTSLKIGSHLVNPTWDENIDKFLSPFPDDLKMEKVRFRWWGNIC
ncbi:protein kinase subdomain-containing protein [Diaporthe amygdali]|uniref:protein kinase subdomain-containing protein n=1 Tax=Phomopsis amygdali TaxID=1214568 RepID=UPI0022FDF57D|nr:protein kinase subdomain-containing protein [Diaporthe amygdali]KAJ0124414.1 protein kinase subdomain-containing protein [Diaporthe amygdali]